MGMDISAYAQRATPVLGAFSTRELEACAMREVGHRRRVYARLVEEGRMPARKAAREIALMEEIGRHFKALADLNEGLAPQLVEGHSDETRS